LPESVENCNRAQAGQAQAQISAYARQNHTAVIEAEAVIRLDEWQGRPKRPKASWWTRATTPQPTRRAASSHEQTRVAWSEPVMEGFPRPSADSPPPPCKFYHSLHALKIECCWRTCSIASCRCRRCSWRRLCRQCGRCGFSLCCWLASFSWSRRRAPTPSRCHQMALKSSRDRGSLLNGRIHRYGSAYRRDSQLGDC
jgi:hypothetical protein